MNLILLIVDYLRADHVGVLDNSWIRAPNPDRLGRQSVRFTRAYPESLATIPVRRALRNGKRVYPFRDWKP